MLRSIGAMEFGSAVAHENPVTKLRRFLFGVSVARRLVSCVTAILYAGLVFGFPMPAVARKTDGDRPYACQSRACGCSSAEQFWKSCCCFSPSERLKWAEEQGVIPPEYAERPSDESPSTPAKSDSVDGDGGCCSTSEPKSCCSQPSCCETTTETPKPKQPKSPCRSSCCEVKAGAGSTKESSMPSTDAPRPSPAKAVQFVFGLSAQKCKGLTSSWFAAGEAPTPPVWIQWTFQDERVGIVVLTVPVIDFRSEVPLLRPPRV